MTQNNPFENMKPAPVAVPRAPVATHVDDVERSDDARVDHTTLHEVHGGHHVLRTLLIILAVIVVVAAAVVATYVMVPAVHAWLSPFVDGLLQ